MPNRADATDLLRACRRGDESAARSLHALLAPALLVYARAVLRDSALAEDAVQSSFCKIFALPTGAIDGVDDATAWLARIVRRESLNLLRTRSRAARRETTRPTSPSPAIPASTDLAHLTAAIEQLPRQFREVISLRHVAGLSFDQIALALDANRNTIATRHRRALDRLRTMMDPALEKHPAAPHALAPAHLMEAPHA